MDAPSLFRWKGFAAGDWLLNATLSDASAASAVSLERRGEFCAAAVFPA